MTLLQSRNHRWLVPILLTLVLTCTPPLANGVEVGEMGELSFQLHGVHLDPFAVTFKATFRRDATEYAFWGFYAGNVDGADTWTVRYNLPAAGVWHYETDSSNGPLDRRTGKVVVDLPGPHNRGVLTAKGRAFVWENTAEPYFLFGQTAYALLHKNVPWRTVMDWLEGNGFNNIRIDLGSDDTDGGFNDLWLWGGTPGRPNFGQFNLDQWDKIDAVLSEGARRGFTFEVGLTTLLQVPAPGPRRTRYLRYVAARLGAYPHLIYQENYELEGPVRGFNPTEKDVEELGAEIASIFHTYPRQPLLGVHTVRNFTYLDGETGDTFYHVSHGPPTPAGGRYDFRGERWLTSGILHERWKMEGFGILQHRPHFAIPLYVAEAMYETTDERLVQERDSDRLTVELDAFKMADEVVNDPRFYYRRYVYSVILSGGAGVTYGLQGDSIYRDDNGGYIPRWATGVPSSRDGRNGAAGFKDMKRAFDYFQTKKLDLNALVPDDTRITNELSGRSNDVLSRELGLRRAKFASLAGRESYFAYNPYHTDLRIRDIPAGLRIDIFDPQTGNVYSGGRTDGRGVFAKPSAFQGDYVLHIFSDR